MRHSVRVALVGFALTAASAVACNNSSTTTGSTGGPMGGASAKLPCDVDKIMVDHCQSCHGSTPLFGAPMPLVTYADLMAPAVTDKTKKVYELVETRIHDTMAPMPQPPTAALDSANLSTIDDWVKADAPEASTSDPACVSQTTSSTGAGGGDGLKLDCTPDIYLAPTSAWTMPKTDTDVYVCYGVDVPAGDRKNVIGFVPHIINKKIVHHILLFQTETSTSSTPTPCDGSFSVNSTQKLVYGWAPGGVAFKLPDAAGFPMDATTHYLVQVHYNNIQGLSGETDTSGFDLCSTPDTRPNAADVIAFGTLKIDLPPNQTTSTDCTYKWPKAAGSVTAIAAFPHMHKLGSAIFTKQNPDTDNVDLGKNDPWDFNNQPFMPITATLNPGDTIETKCTWDNTTPDTVNWGEYTEDEMCFSFTMYYPAAPSFKSWIQPSFLSTCQAGN